MKKYYKYIIIIIFLIIIYFILNTKEENEIVNLNETIETITIDIKGAINNPGVYQLEIGSNVNDAINISGGLTTIADTSTINLSKELKDEMVIIIYTQDEINEMKKGSTSIKYIENECICPILKNDACIEEIYTNSDPIETKININTATIEQLMTIKGIGESKAQAIIKYREANGLFKNINEITNVSGIGKSIYEKIKDQITV